MWLWRGRINSHLIPFSHVSDGHLCSSWPCQLRVQRKAHIKHSTLGKSRGEEEGRAGAAKKGSSAESQRQATTQGRQKCRYMSVYGFVFQVMSDMCHFFPFATSWKLPNVSSSHFNISFPREFAACPVKSQTWTWIKWAFPCFPLTWE